MMLNIFVFLSFFTIIFSENVVYSNVIKNNNITSETVVPKVNETIGISALRQEMTPIQKEPSVVRSVEKFDQGGTSYCEYSEILRKIWTVLSTYLSNERIDKVESPNLNKIRNTMTVIKTYIQGMPKDYQNDNLLKKLIEVEVELNKDVTFLTLDSKLRGDSQHFNPAEKENLKTGAVFQYELPSPKNKGCREAFERLLQTARDAYLQVINNPLYNKEIQELVVTPPYYLKYPMNNELASAPSIYEQLWQPSSKINHMNIGPDITNPYLLGIYPNEHNNENSFVNFPIFKKNGNLDSPRLPIPNSQNKHNGDNRQLDHLLIKYPEESINSYVPFFQTNTQNGNINQQGKSRFELLLGDFLRPRYKENTSHKVNPVRKLQKNHYIDENIAAPLTQLDGLSNRYLLENDFTSQNIQWNKLLPNDPSTNSNTITSLYAQSGTRNVIGNMLSTNGISVPLTLNNIPTAIEFTKVIPKRVYDLGPKYDYISPSTSEKKPKYDPHIEKDIFYKKVASNDFTDPELVKLLPEELYKKNSDLPNIDNLSYNIFKNNFIQPKVFPVNSPKHFFFPSIPNPNQNRLMHQPENIDLHPFQTTYNKTNILQPDAIASGLSTSSNDIPDTEFAVANIHKLKSSANKAGIIELTYLLKQVNHVVYQPFYFVKYRMPYDTFLSNIHNLMLIKPYLSNNQNKVFQEIMSKANVTEVSADLKDYSTSDILKLVSKNGALIKTKVISNDSNLQKHENAIGDVNSKFESNTKRIDLNDQITNLYEQIKNTKISEDNKNKTVDGISRFTSDQVRNKFSDKIFQINSKIPIMIPDQPGIEMNTFAVLNKKMYEPSNTDHLSSLNNDAASLIMNGPTLPVAVNVIENNSKIMLSNPTGFSSALPIVSSNGLLQKPEINTTPQQLGTGTGNLQVTAYNPKPPFVLSRSDYGILPLLHAATLKAEKQEKQNAYHTGQLGLGLQNSLGTGTGNLQVTGYNPKQPFVLSRFNYGILPLLHAATLKAENQNTYQTGQLGLGIENSLGTGTGNLQVAGYNPKQPFVLSRSDHGIIPVLHAATLKAEKQNAYQTGQLGLGVQNSLGTGTGNLQGAGYNPQHPFVLSRSNYGILPLLHAATLKAEKQNAYQTGKLGLGVQNSFTRTNGRYESLPSQINQPQMEREVVKQMNSNTITDFIANQNASLNSEYLQTSSRI